VSRQLVETTLLERIKEDLLCPEGIELFIKETEQLLHQQPSSTLDLTKQLRQTEKEIRNVMKAIKAGILTESTESEVHTLEAKQTALLAKL